MFMIFLVICLHYYSNKIRHLKLRSALDKIASFLRVNNKYFKEKYKFQIPISLNEISDVFDINFVIYSN